MLPILQRTERSLLVALPRTRKGAADTIEKIHQTQVERPDFFSKHGFELSLCYFPPGAIGQKKEMPRKAAQTSCDIQEAPGHETSVQNKCA